MIFGATTLIMSCGDEASSEFPVSRIIRNDTDIEVEIEVYSGGILFESISIQDHAAHRLDVTCVNVTRRVPVCPARFSDESDTVRVIFGGKRFVTYCSDEEAESCFVNNKNIMFFNAKGGPQKTGYVEEDQVFVFTLTQADLDVAIPLEN